METTTQDAAARGTSTIAKRAAVALAASAVALLLASCSLLAPNNEADTDDPVVEETSTQGIENEDDTNEPSSNDAALDAYVQLERDQIPAIMDAYGDYYSDVSFDAIYPNTVSYAYYYKEQVDPAQAGPMLDGQISALQDVLDSAVFPTMIDMGVEGTPGAVYSYYNADGTLIWSHTFAPSGA